MSTVEYSRIRQYGITPALCIIACLCFGFFALVVWDTILTIALERNNDFRSNGTLASTPSSTPATVATASGATLLANNKFDVPVAVVAGGSGGGGGGKKNARAEVLASKKTQLQAAVLSDNDTTDVDDDVGEHKHWKADIPVAARNDDDDDGDVNVDNDDAKWKADVEVAHTDGEDEDDDSNIGNAAAAVDDGLDRFEAVVVDESSDGDSSGSDGGNVGSTSITFATAPTAAPTPGSIASKRDKDAAEIRLARGAIKTGNKYIDEKKAKETTPKQAAQPQQQQQQAPRVLSMAERRQALIDVQKQARDAELQRIKRV